MQVKLQNNWYSPRNHLERIEENPHTWNDEWFDYLPPSALVLNEGTGEWETLDDSYIGGPARAAKKEAGAKPAEKGAEEKSFLGGPVKK